MSRGRLAHAAHFPWPELVQSWCCFPLEGSRALLRIPCPHSPSAQGISEPILKDKGILFSTTDSLWKMGWDCSAAQWIKILDIVSSLAGGAQCVSCRRPWGSTSGSKTKVEIQLFPVFVGPNVMFYSFHCGLGREFGHLDASPRDPLRILNSDPALFQIHPKGSTHLCVSFPNILNTSAFLFKFKAFLCSLEGCFTFQVGNLGRNKMGIKETLLESALSDFTALSESSFSWWAKFFHM